jgi:hypothetical protein
MPEWFKDWWPVLVALVGALWAAFVYFDKRRREARKTNHPNVSASGGSVAAGRDMRGNTITTHSTPEPPKPLEPPEP